MPEGSGEYATTANAADNHHADVAREDTELLDPPSGASQRLVSAGGSRPLLPTPPPPMPTGVVGSRPSSQRSRAAESFKAEVSLTSAFDGPAPPPLPRHSQPGRRASVAGGTHGVGGAEEGGGDALRASVSAGAGGARGRAPRTPVPNTDNLDDMNAYLVRYTEKQPKRDALKEQEELRIHTPLFGGGAVSAEAERGGNGSVASPSKPVFSSGVAVQEGAFELALDATAYENATVGQLCSN